MRLVGKQRYLTVQVLGVFVAVVLAAASLELQSPLRDLVVGVSSSFLFGSAVILLELGHRRLVDREAREFFGSELLDEGATLAYPDFELNQDVRELVATHNQQLLYVRPASRFSEATHRIDLPRAVAANDMQALVYMSTLFEATQRRPMEILVDRSVTHRCDRSFISVGLSSNDCTHLYLHTAEKPLFSIVEADGTEHIRLIDGQEFRSTSTREYGILLRHVPEPELHPERRWFLVAGLGATATTGAAWFLSQYWRSLHEQTRRGDFIAVVSMHTATERRVRLETVVRG